MGKLCQGCAFPASNVLKTELHCHQCFFQQKMFVLLISLSILAITQSSLETDNGAMRNLNLLLFVELLATACKEMWSGERTHLSYPRGHCSHLKLGAVGPLCRTIPLQSREPCLRYSVWQLYWLLILKSTLICISQTAG